MSNDDLYSPIWQVEFWRGAEKYAMRHYRTCIPAPGDEVRFDGSVYKIAARIWFFDERMPRVALEMGEASNP